MYELVVAFGERYLDWMLDHKKHAPDNSELRCEADKQWVIEPDHVHFKAAISRAVLCARTALGPLPPVHFIKPMIVKTWNQNMGVIDDFLFSSKTILAGIQKSVPFTKLLLYVLDFIAFNAVRAYKLCCQTIKRASVSEKELESRSDLRSKV